MTGEFNFKLEETNVVEYEENKKLICQDGLISSIWFQPRLDQFLTGLLDNDNPSVSIKTLDKDNIECYKTEIKGIILESLKAKENRISIQLEILERLKEKINY